MIAASIAVAVIAVLFAVAVVIACYHMVEVERDRVEQEVARHEACHVEVERVLSNVDRTRNQSTILRRMAEKYDSIEEQAVLGRLGREQFVPGGPSVPALWLGKQADDIDARADARLVVEHGGPAA